MADVDLTDEDRATLTAAANGKSIAQINAVTEKIRRDYLAGNIRSLIPYAAKLIREQQPVRTEIDRKEQNDIEAARRLCSNLNLEWAGFHVHALDAVKRFRTHIKPATDATWNDHRARLFADTAFGWWDRFIQHCEQLANRAMTSSQNREEATASAPP